MSEPLHIKYRPEDFDDVIGQDATVLNLKRLFETGRVPHCFLLTGPSGTGKTTLGRIIARRLEADRQDVDAARYSGIDQMRALLDNLRFAPLGAKSTVVIIDEAHALSKATFQTLLLATEDPPPHLYWVLCTTEPDKVPATIKTRAHSYDLKPVKWDLLAGYLGEICKVERLKVKAEFIDLAARKASGSVRQALVFLSLLDGIIEKADALQLVEEAEAAGEGAVALARMLVSGKGASWANARKLLEGMSDLSPETIRLTVINYTANVLAKTESEKEAAKMLAIIQAFSGPCGAGEKMAPILLAVGGLLLQ